LNTQRLTTTATTTSAVSEEHIVSELTKYGLSYEEAKVYFNLVKIGPSKASTIAASTGFDRVKTYRILQKLVEERLVEASFSKPMLFTAHPPQEVLNNLTQQMRNKLKAAEDGLKNLLEEWRRLPMVTPTTPQPKFRILQGRMHVYSQIVKMLGKAVREALFLTQGDDLVWLRHGGVQDALFEAAKRGVYVKILTEFDNRLIDIVREYSDRLEVRHAKIPSLFRLFIIDSSEAVISTYPTPPSRLDEEEDVALWTDSQPFASGLEIFFNELWQNALDAKLRIRSLVSGIQPEEMRVLRSFDEAKLVANRMLASAKNEIFSAYSLPEQQILPDGIWQIYRVLADKGVKLKHITTPDLNNLDSVGDLMGVAEVRLLDRLPFQIILVDRRELLLAPASFEEGLIHPIWSNIASYAEVMLSVLSRIWEDARDATVMLRNLRFVKALLSTLSAMKRELEEVGWVVQDVPEVKGASGLPHRFSAVLQRISDPSAKIALEWCVDASSQTVLSFLAKCLDVKPSRLVLLTSSDITTQTSNLASIYGIELAKVSNPADMKASILALISGKNLTLGS